MNAPSLPTLLVLLLTALVPACALGPQAKPEADAQARLFQPVPDKAVIYLLREYGDIYTVEVKVSMDGKDVGSTWPGTYYRWVVEPGEHTITSYTQPPAILALKTEPGGIYYVWQDINVGRLREQTRLYQVDKTTARLVLNQAYLLESKPE